MNLLHVVNLAGRGGMEHLFASYFDASAGGDPVVHVAAKGAIHQAFRNVRAARGRVSSVKKVGALPVPDLGGLRDRNIRRIVRRVRPGRVVFWSTLPTDAWRRACRESGAAMVYYDHGKAWRLPVDEASRALADVPFAVTVSSGGARILSERIGYPGPVHVVPNGLRLPEGSAAGRRPYLADGVLRVGFAGRLVDKKGLPVLLAVIAGLRRRGVPCRLDVAGDGPGLGRCRELVREHALDDCVRFRGNVADMAGFYRDVDVLVVPSLHEPFGLVSIEAAACGAVPVVTGVDGLAETVRDGDTGRVIPVTGDVSRYEALGGGADGLPEYVHDPVRDVLVPPGIPDPDRLTEALEGLARDPERLREMAAAAEAHVRTAFSVDRYAATLNRVLVQSDAR
ncbi:glycosyltransferase family 4 protein [Aquisalimonas lutea]|uniref:glycosyltransferase family 4 protein n=1 Tax=Aquisalimonas lutea TaxID=1327750 RepID=UPI0025B59364|nr:glycosyltransferase family 4 protein [Aquisalimonas lutea]MDN3517874.1 glycosyltransferase family 4 protein [Aquisalimonas lutea]